MTDISAIGPKELKRFPIRCIGLMSMLVQLASLYKPCAVQPVSSLSQDSDYNSMCDIQLCTYINLSL